MAAIALAAGSVCFLVILRITVPDQVARTAGPTILLLVSAFAFHCHRRGRIRCGLLVLGIGVWLEITLMSVITGGMKAPAIYLYPIVILMAGWLLSLRVAYAFAALSVLACLALTPAESMGHLSPASNQSLLYLAIQSSAIVFTTVLVRRIVISYQARLREVSKLSDDLGEQVAALARSEASYHDLFNTVHEAIYIQDRDGRFLDVNASAVRMYGHPRERFIGHTPEFVSAPGMNDLARIGTSLERAFAGEPQRFEFWGLRADGTPFPKDVRLVRGTWFDREVVIATAEDITARKAAEEELRNSEEKFHKVFRSSPISIAITRLADGCILDMNSAFSDLFGWTREETIGRTSVEIGCWIRPEERLAWTAEMQLRGRVANYEVAQRNKQGEELLVLLSSEVIQLRGEACALVLAIDQTARKKTEAALQESKARLDEAQRIGHVGSWELDIPGRHMTWSEEIHRIYECAPGAFGGSFKDLLAFVHPEDVPAMVSLYRDLASRPGHHEHKHRILMPDGRVKSIHAQWELLFDDDGKPIRALGTAQDVTALERARAEIELLNADLEKRVLERTAELTAANRELESFAYSISHDLRSPLRGIDGFSHLLAEEYSDRLDTKGLDYLARVRRATQRMGALIDDILELSRVTRLEMRREQVDLSGLANELIDEMARGKPQRRPAVSVAPACVTNGDPQLLRLMMQNLLENAWKYSSKCTSPKIEFGCETVDGTTVFFVRDNGVGFDSQFAGRLFTPFQRLHKPEE
ncbi:MAG: PAS domain S-box protein, partial [Rhodocyclaceae bacterium]|nr:PAS domain S-box protein [Rhodocyclaceae bacterium]